MKGGFNKLLRNIVAGASDTEFEKVYNKSILIAVCRDWQKRRSTWTTKNQKRNTLSVSQ